MQITKEGFHEKLINEYQQAHTTLSWGTGVLGLLIEHLNNYNRIVNSIEGSQSSAVMRLLIGKMLSNYYNGYKLEVSFYEDDEYTEILKDQYLDNPQEYIDYDINSETSEKENPYKDLIKLEKYLSILISQDELIEEELVNLYKKVCEYNKLCLFEKREKLSLFFHRNYNFEFDFNEARNVFAQLLLDYRTYVGHKETCDEFINPLIANMDRFKNDCRKLTMHHERLYFEILNIINRIKAGMQNDEINVEELLEYKNILDNELMPITITYFEKSYQCREEN